MIKKGGRVNEEERERVNDDTAVGLVTKAERCGEL